MKVKNYKDKLVRSLKLSRRVQLSLIFTICFIVLFVLSFVVYSYLLRDKVYAGLTFGNSILSNKSAAETAEIIKNESNSFLAGKIVVKTAAKDYDISFADITLNYNADESAAKAVSEFHQNTLSNYWERFLLLFKKRKITPVYSYNQSIVQEKIVLIAKELDQPEKDYGLKITSGQVEVTTERSTGKRFNQEKFIEQFKLQLEELNPAAIQPVVETKEPEVTLENAEQAKVEAEAILSGGDLTLANSEKSYLIDVDTISNWITATPTKDDLVIDLDRTKVKDFLKTVAQSIDVGPQDAALSVSGGKVVISQASRDGATVDIDATASKIATVLLGRIIAKDGNKLKTIAIEVKTIKPSVTSETLASLGLNDLIGSGTTSFTGSPSNRVTNITVGARLLNGSLIKPGETFSTLGHLGTIDASSGYLPELVIKENRTVAEYGGGLCQVSTTLFRAALNSGLKINERQNHKYRVSYYEPPVGMDATIYDPAPDFKFTNDTANYILVQSKVAGTKITFDFYGTKDGRTVSLSSPVISNVTAPEAPIMEPTDTLPTGETKQVEKAHDGSDASFTYTVTRNGEVLHNLTFTSHYVPWRARILVGTGPVAPAPTPPTDPAVTAPVTDTTTAPTT